MHRSHKLTLIALLLLYDMSKRITRHASGQAGGVGEQKGQDCWMSNLSKVGASAQARQVCHLEPTLYDWCDVCWDEGRQGALAREAGDDPGTCCIRHSSGQFS